MPLHDTFSHNFTAHEVELLRRRGITTGVVFHGDDIRDHDRHVQSVSGSYVLGLGDDYRRRLIANARKRRRLVEELGIPIFVSTPDLALEVPDSTWLPLAVQRTVWESSRGALERRKPRVLFRPTSSAKGTSVVVPALEGLERRGMIEFVHPTVVPHEQMPDLYRSVDIVVDQIRTGSYGVAAIEAMSAGRLCVGFLSDEVREFMPRPPPVVDASVETFEKTMEQILVDKEHYSELASQGPDFVREQHDGRASARVLSGFLSQGLRQD
jgi:glycosyltransferase involved in cell wall biosynthesis